MAALIRQQTSRRRALQLPRLTVNLAGRPVVMLLLYPNKHPDAARLEERRNSLSWIILSCRVRCILPVAVLRLVDGKPMLDILVVPLDDESGIVEVIIDDLPITPPTIFIEQG